MPDASFREVKQLPLSDFASADIGGHSQELGSEWVLPVTHADSVSMYVCIIIFNDGTFSPMPGTLTKCCICIVADRFHNNHFSV